MIGRLSFIVITLFWVTMNVLLWRYEFGDRNEPGSMVPVEMVWRRILNAPDHSTLQVMHHGRKIGYCRWTPNVGQEKSTETQTADTEIGPEGMIRKPSGYTIDAEGSISLDQFVSRLRFNCYLKLATNRVWEEFQLRLGLRPNAWEVQAIASEQLVRLRVDDESGQFTRWFSFQELQRPDQLLHQFGGSLLPLTLQTLGIPTASRDLSSLSPGLKWKANVDWLKIGQARVRCYRLRAKLWDRFQVTIYVSTTGEILRFELPDEIVLINDGLLYF